MTDITDKLTKFFSVKTTFICKKGNSWADHSKDFGFDGVKVAVIHQNTVSNDEGERCTVCDDLIKGPFLG